MWSLPLLTTILFLLESKTVYVLQPKQQVQLSNDASRCVYVIMVTVRQLENHFFGFVNRDITGKYFVRCVMGFHGRSENSTGYYNFRTNFFIWIDSGRKSGVGNFMGVKLSSISSQFNPKKTGKLLNRPLHRGLLARIFLVDIFWICNSYAIRLPPFCQAVCPASIFFFRY